MKKSAKITLGFLSVVVAVSFAAPLSIILSKKTETPAEIHVDLNLKSDVSTLEDDIKYVAIGDSIAAGFNAKFGYDQGGYLNIETNKIEGLSYPSYLANAIKMTNDENTKLSSYINFGLTGTTVDDWLYLLDPSSYDINSDEYKKIKNNLAFDLSLDKSPKNPIKMYSEDRLKYLFNDFQVENNQTGKLIDELKKANLLTISLGANDYLSYVDLFDLISVLSIQDSEENDVEIKTKYDKFIQQSQKFKIDITKKYTLLLNKLRKINPDLNINIISYPMPFVRITNMIDKKYAKVKENFSDFVINSLNNVLKDIALQNNVNYINSFNKELWKLESKELASNIFDIHPDILGYKKMAQDIFLKMSYNPNRENNLNKEITEFERSDKGSYKQVINFKKYTNNQIKLLVYGVYALNNNTFDVSYDFENNTINQNITKFIALNPNIDIETLLENYLSKDELIFDFDQIKSYMRNALNNIGLKIENFPNFERIVDNIIKQNGDNNFLKQVIIEFIHTGIFGKIFNKIKRDVEILIDSKPVEYIQSKEIEQIIKNAVFDHNIIYDSLRKFVLSDFFKNNYKNQTLKEVIFSLLDDFLDDKNFIPFSTTISKSFAQVVYSNKKTVSKIIEELKEIITHIIDDYSAYFKDAPTLTDFLIKVYETNKIQIIDIVKMMVNSITESKVSIDLLINLILEKLESKNTNNLSVDNKDKIKYFLHKLIVSFKDKPFFENVVSKFVDLIFENINKPNTDIDNIISIALTSSILDIYPGNANGEIIVSLLSDNLDDSKYLDGMRTLIEFIANKNYLENINISDLSQNQSLFNLDKLKTIFLNVINNDKINKNQIVKDNLKLFVKYLLQSNVLNNNLINQFIYIYSQGNVVNKLYEKIDFLNITDKLNIDLVAEKGLNNALNLWFKNLINELFADQELKAQIIQSFNNIIDNLDILKGQNLNEILINTLKNIKILEPKKLVNKFINVVLKNGQSKQIAIKILTSIFKEYSQLDFSDQQINLLNENISKVLGNISNSSLFDDLLDVFEHIDFSKTTTLESIFNVLVETIKNYFNFSNIDVINNILALIVAKDENNHINVTIDKWLQTLKPVFENEKFIDFVFEKINLNKIIDKLFNAIDISNKNWDQSTVDNFNSFILQSKNLIKNNLQNWSKSTLQSIFKELFSEESIQLSQTSPSLWFKQFVIENLINKVSNISKVILDEVFKNNEYKQSALIVVSQIIKEYLKPYINITNPQAIKLSSTLEKILKQLNNQEFIKTVSIELTNIITQSVTLSDDVVLSVHFKGGFGLNKLFELLKQVNIEEFVDLLNEDDIKNLLEIINNNKEKLFDRLNLDSKQKNQNSEEIKENKLQDLSDLNTIIYKIVPKLVKKINSFKSSAEISNILKEIITFILQNQKSHDFLKTSLKNLYPSIENSLKISNDYWNSFVDYLIDDLLVNSKTNEFITTLIDSIFTNNKKTIAQIENIFDLIKETIKLNKDSITTYIHWLSKQDKLQDFLAEITFVQINKLKDITSVKDEFKSLFKNVVANIDNSELVNVFLDTFINMLNQVTFDNNTDLSSIFNKDFLTKFNLNDLITPKNAKWILTNIFSNQNKQSLDQILIKLIADDKENNEIKISQDSQNNQSSNNFNLWALIKKFSNTLSKTNDAQTINNIVSSIENLLNGVVEKQLNLDKITFLDQSNQTFIKNVLKKSLKNEKITNILKLIVEEFLTTDTYKNVENIENFINQVIKNNLDQILTNIKELVIKIIKTDENQNDLFEILINLLNSKLETKVDANTKANLKEIYLAILSNIETNPIFDQLINELKSIINANDIVKTGLILNTQILDILTSIFENKDKILSFLNKENLRPILLSIFNEDRSEQINIIINFFINAKWINKEINIIINFFINAKWINKDTQLQIKVLDILKAFGNVLNNEDTLALENITKAATKFLQNYLENNININQLTNIFTPQNQDNIKNILISVSKDEEFSKLLKNILSDYLLTNKYKDSQSLAQFFNNLIKNNVDVFIQHIKKIIKNILTNAELKQKLSSILINVIENKLNLTLDDEIKTSLQNILNKVYEFISDDNILNSLQTEISSFIQNNDLLDDNLKLNANLIKNLINTLKNKNTINNLLSNTNIKVFLETFFNQNINSDIVKVIKLFVSQIQNQSVDQVEQTKTNVSLNIEDLLLQILQNASNIYTHNNKNTNVLNNLSELVALLLNEFVVEKIDLNKITFLDENNKLKTKNIIKEILNLDQTKTLVAKLLENYFTTDKYEHLDSIVKIINSLVNNNLDTFSNDLKIISKSALNNQNIKDNLKDIITSIFANTFNIQDTKIKNNFKDILESFISFIQDSNVLDKVFSNIKDNLVNKNILLADKTLNPEILNLLKELFTNETIIEKLLDKQSFKLLVSKLFSNENKQKIIDVVEAIINSKWNNNIQDTNNIQLTNQKQSNFNIINWIFKVAKLATGSLNTTENQENINNLNEIALFVAQNYVKKQLDVSSVDILDTTHQNILKDVIVSTLKLNTFKQLSNKVLTNFFTSNQYNDVEDIYKLVNKLVKNNLDNISSDVVSTINDILKSNKTDHLLSQIIINIIEHKLQKEIPQNIKLDLQNIIEKATNEIDKTTFITKFFDIVKEVLNTNDIFDQNNNFNKEILNSIYQKLFDEMNLKTLFSKENVQHIFNNLLTKEHLEHDINQIVEAYKWFRFNDFSISQNKTSNETDSTQTINFDLIVKILKAGNGILEGSDDNLKQNIKKLLKAIAKIEIKEANLLAIVENAQNASKTKDFLTKIVDYASVDTALDTLLIKFLDKSYDLSSANDINELIKKYLDLSKEDVLNNLQQFVNELITKDKDLLDEFIINAINKQLIHKLTEQNKNNIKNISTRIFNFIKSNSSYKDIIGHVIDSLKQINFIKNNKIDTDAIQQEIAKKFNFNTITSLITKANISSLLNNLFNDDASVNDFFELYKTLRSNIKFSTNSTQENSENSSNTNSQSFDQSSLFNFISSILKTLNGSLDNEQISTRVAQVISKILKYELSNFDAQEFNINGIFKIETINKVIHSVGNSSQLEDAISKITKHYLHTNDSTIQQANNLNDVLKAIIKSNLDLLKQSLANILSFAVSENNNENFIANDIFNYLNKTYHLEFTETDSESRSFIDFVSRAIDTMTNKNYFTTLLNNILDQVVDLDFFINNQFNQNLISSLLEKIITNTNWSNILTSEFGKDFINVLINDNELTQNTDQINENQSDKIFNLYKFIKKLIINIQNQNSENNQSNSVANTASVQDNNKKFRNIEDLLLKIFLAFNNSLANTEHSEQKLIIIQKSIHKIIKDVILNIDLSSFINSNPNVTKQQLQDLIREFISYNSIQTFTNKIVKDILKSDIKHWKEYKQGDDSNLPKLISLIINHEQEAIIKLLKETLTEFFNKKQNADNVTNLIFKLMKIENTNTQDVNLVSNVLQKLVPHLLKNDWFNKKILLRSFWWLSKKALEFKIEQPTKWIEDAFLKVLGAIGKGDIGIILDFVGDKKDNPISSEEFTKIINLIFEKSNFENSLLYNGLRNLNRNPDKTKRTNKKDLDNIVGNSAFEAIGKLISFKSKADPIPPDENPAYMVSSNKSELDILDKVYKTISSVFWKQNIPHDAAGYKQRRQNFAYKALYRVYTTVNYAVFQMYFRETTDREREEKFIRWWKGGTTSPSILWILLEDTVLGLKRLNKTLKSSLEHPQDLWTIRNEMNAYYHYRGKTFGRDYFADEQNYRPDDIIYILTTSEFPENDPNKKNYSPNVYFGPSINNGKPLSKKEYVLWTIREGSWGKFMNQSSLTSLNVNSNFADWQNTGHWWSPKWTIVSKIQKGQY
ncbi:SGNH/GDSL hydrolase family protein [Mycoplasma miroungirhinis]|uniref:SGNH/GDSL hydrolase family protein n=1 Tax=Mycoplasma miroungirhinis TaxID=754516 RepID=A0A6M4JCW9_9MOLU|nr:SGNH/GDSL hydrolase family protein [Mycoplasma miroungirhinis]QJR44118.1 SGNH/GDSL hydrolase family protein [Mycoplasma miroungirhinis]